MRSNPQGRDLSNITNDFWKVFFIKKHGKNEADVLFARMQKRNITCKWRSLFEVCTSSSFAVLLFTFPQLCSLSMQYKEREKEAKEEQAIENLRRKNEEAKRGKICSYHISSSINLKNSMKFLEAEKHKERVKRMLIAPKPEKRRKTTQQFTSGSKRNKGTFLSVLNSLELTFQARIRNVEDSCRSQYLNIGKG